MKMNFFVEIGVENFPAKHLDNTLESMSEILKKVLPFEFKINGTCKRLVVQITDIIQQEYIEEKEILGPPYELAFTNGEINIVGQKFLEKNLLSNFKIRAEGVKKYIVGLSKITRTLDEILIQAINSLFTISFYTSMTWSGIKFLRPIRYITAFINNRELKFQIGEIVSSNYINVNSEKVVITGYDDYLSKTKNILLNKEDRAKNISNEVERNSVFNEFINTVENPKAVLCSFNKKFLDLPYEVIKKSVAIHQFGIMSKDKKDSYYIICERQCEDNLVAKGNEKEVNARLSDAELFVKVDDKKTIDEFVNELSNITFQENLGSMLDKQKRLTKLSELYSKKYNLNKDIISAAKISKFDLATNIVREKDFNELRGYIGQEYAKRREIKEEVANVLFEHYLPRFSGDILPKTLESAILSILDKADNIVSASILGKLPTGAKDPMYIRRDAIGIISILDKFNLNIQFSELYRDVLKVYREMDTKLNGINTDKHIEDIASFMNNRIENYMSNSYDKPVINAVLVHSDNFADMKERLVAISQMNLEPLKKIYIRLEKFINKSFKIKNSLVTELEEKLLLEQLNRIKIDSNYKLILEQILNIESYIEAFFDKIIVMVKDDEIKQNRIAILTLLFSIIDHVMDIEKLVKG